MRAARALIAHPDSGELHDQEKNALAEIDAAIAELKSVADDGKGVDDHPGIDTHARWIPRLNKAVEQAVALGCTDAAAVRHLVVAGELAHREQPLRKIGSLECYERSLPVLSDYDQLLETVTP